MRKTELLSPARNLAIGVAAIRNGADAVYIGAPAFGARKSAANSVEDIAALVEYAHRFYCRVFVTLNTLLYDQELIEAEKMIRQLYTVGVDALILQDMGILQLDLPPIALHASTQMHNYDLERIKFIDRLGFQRIVLARELSLEQIREIRREVKAELEVFVHGALCVSLSGQCYLSHYLSGRSANRGECAQPCRMKWSVKDQTGKEVVKDKYVLSLKDLNLSAYLDDLIEAGVDSFKIEGRLKDENYVANVTNYYSSLLNQHPGIKRTGSGRVVAGFTPEPKKSFNRGYSEYFIKERQRGLVNMETPKSIGKKVGTVVACRGNCLEIEGVEELHNGDGLCYLAGGELKGIRVNLVKGRQVFYPEKVNIAPGTAVYRNYDHQFAIRIEKSKSNRKISVVISCFMEEDRFVLQATDENGVKAEYISDSGYEVAQNPNQQERFQQQLMKFGDTDFECRRVEVKGERMLFVPAAAVNVARRSLSEQLQLNREKQRPRIAVTEINREAIGPKEVDWHFNVINRKAEEFYRQHGAETVEKGFEQDSQAIGKDLMRTRYCLLFELGRCRKIHRNTDLRFPLVLCNEKQEFQLDFNCTCCWMKVVKK